MGIDRIVKAALREERKRKTPKPVKRRNRNRVEIALQALALVDEGGDPGVVDLFANLIHFCHRDGIDYIKAFQVAVSQYEAEA